MPLVFGDPAEPRGRQPLSSGVCCGTRAWDWDWETSGEGLSSPEPGKDSLHQKLWMRTRGDVPIRTPGAAPGCEQRIPAGSRGLAVPAVPCVPTDSPEPCLAPRSRILPRSAGGCRMRLPPPQGAAGARQDPGKLQTPANTARISRESQAAHTHWVTESCETPTASSGDTSASRTTTLPQPHLSSGFLPSGTL